MPEIIASNSLTLFNAVNVVLALLVASTGAYRNMLFMLVVFFNLGIGIFQELRSKINVDRLSILATHDVSVMRNGTKCLIAPHDLVLDDLIMLAHGDQVPADSVIVQGSVRMDESLLTGESEMVDKGPGDIIYSGSFVATGSLSARICTVGAEGYAARINAEAKKSKQIHSEMLDTLRVIIRIASVALVPLGLGLYLRSLGQGVTHTSAILSSVAAMVGMIPQGLVLLTSSVLAIATTRLAQKNVLVQQLYCIENLARVDTICLDKTGTITSGNMEVDQIIPAPRHTREELVQAVSNIVCALADDANDTARALLGYVADQHVESLQALRTTPFSSERKFSAVVCDDDVCYVMGAGQFVFGSSWKTHQGLLSEVSESSRVISVGASDVLDEKGLPQSEPEFLGFVILKDQIRDTAAQTVSYFCEQGVELRVISGDDPKTVSAIAERVGIPHADAYVDASSLSDAELLAALDKTCVFGRVTPQQKRLLIEGLHDKGHRVAMTGDGVNDVLALREADCSVAMASGSDAARNIAELVLVDNDFAHMPEVVAEGRRSINNLQRSAVLFLVKTVFSALLAALCVVLPPYPFVPIQMTLISSLIIGIPSFVLALEPNHERVQGSFFSNVFSRSVPASLAIVLCVGTTICLREFYGFSLEEASTMAMIETVLIGLSLIVRISLPLTRLRQILICGVAVLALLAISVFGSFFHVVALSRTQAMLTLCLSLGGIVFLQALYGPSIKRFVRLAPADTTTQTKR